MSGRTLSTRFGRRTKWCRRARIRPRFSTSICTSFMRSPRAGVQRPEVAGSARAAPRSNLGDHGSFDADVTEQVFGKIPIKLDAAAKQVRQLESNAPNSGWSCSTCAMRGAASYTSQPGTGLHAARDDHRLRRQSYQHARRIRRPRLRIGTTKSATCFHAVPAAAQAEDLCRQCRGRAAARRDRQGPHFAHHRPDRRVRRHRTRARVSGSTIRALSMMNA